MGEDLHFTFRPFSFGEGSWVSLKQMESEHLINDLILLYSNKERNINKKK